MKRKIDVPVEVEAIYRQWGEGPTADQYYDAVAKFFEAKQRGNQPVEGEHTVGKSR
jgi:hypothetical protein